MKTGARIAGSIAAIAATVLFAIFLMVRNVPTPGDISTALTSNPDAYTLSLGHMRDLTLPALAYLRTEVLLAAVAFAAGAIGAWFWRPVPSLAAMMANPAKADSMGRAARVWVAEHLAPEAHVDQLHAIYEGMAG